MPKPETVIPVSEIVRALKADYHIYAQLMESGTITHTLHTAYYNRQMALLKLADRLGLDFDFEEED